MNTNTQTNNYFNSVMYARAYLNEVKEIKPKKGPAYIAINASIIDTDDNGNKIYHTIDLIARGDKLRKTIESLKSDWPTDRFKKAPEAWLADINIGSPSHGAFEKKNGDAGASLKGRLINIRNLRIGDEDILGEITEDVPKPILVAPCYINLVDVAKGKAKIAILDGKIGEHTAQNVNLTFDGIEAFDQLAKQGLCPKGYKHRDSNAKIFAIVEIEDFRAEGFKTDDGEFKSCLRGQLSGIRYLKVNDKVMLPKSNVTKFAEGFKDGWHAA